LAPLAVHARLLIFTGTLTIRVPKVDAAAMLVYRLASRAGGFISDDERNGDKTHYTAKLTLKVPSSHVSSVLGALAALGAPVSRQQSARDVTEELVNLNAWIRIGRRSVDRLRALLDQAKSTRNLASLESELSRREAALESLRLRRIELHSLIALPIITVELLQKNAPKRTRTGFRAGLVASWHAVTVSVQALVTVIGAMLPWLLALAILTILTLLIMRQARRTRRRPSSDTETKSPDDEGDPHTSTQSPGASDITRAY
jgi:hypothetical protein